MSLKHAILVLLERDPGSGYDLTRRFSQGIGHFWQASHQQIYHQLKLLADEGLVRFDTEAQQHRPDRKVYRITDDGSLALARWKQDAVKPPVVRDALLIRLFAARPEDQPALLDEFDRHLELHRETLAGHLQRETDYFRLDRRRQRELRLPYLTLRRGIRYEREWIAWLEETRTLLQDDTLPEAPV